MDRNKCFVTLPLRLIDKCQEYAEIQHIKLPEAVEYCLAKGIEKAFSQLQMIERECEK